ncbi:uncharacterized protein TA18125 [Theileria annulata]|uniref:Homologous recombination OB-fold protein OB-fold domain-containing protein n=1 Tax=Theileria annulata TaxID=5874 RepID=Q4UB26_THEAN|nr:uncharacterized protein TA18125 [Theileria annulata]CAI75975.1 hypothetical protein TA18125 [Theileria annulata]|eukprot:XP_955451.1 hypothetical protein TA18125 [Theileria annulata]
MGLVDNDLDESLFSEILPIVSCLDPNVPFKNSQLHSHFGYKKVQVQEDIAFTPVNYSSTLPGESTPNLSFQLLGPAGSRGQYYFIEEQYEESPTEKENLEAYKTECWTKGISLIVPEDVNKDSYSDYDDSEPFGDYFSKKYSIDKVINQTKRAYKADCLVVMIDSFVILEPNILVILTDQCDKITGIVYREDIDSYVNEMMPGCVMILVGVTVYTPIGCETHVIISKENVKKIIKNVPMPLIHLYKKSSNK